MRVLVCLLALLALAPSAAAHVKPYVAGNDGLVVANCSTFDTGIGGVCFAPGDANPLNGQDVIFIHDAVINPAGAYACQDLHGVPPPADLSGRQARDVATCGDDPDELSVRFCGSAVIVSTTVGGLWR